jgi:hypothetical protein
MLLLKRTLIILLSALGVILFSLPLAQTEWADNIRNGADHRSERKNMNQQDGSAVRVSGEPLKGYQENDELRKQHRSGPGTLRYLMPFVKSLIMMGIPALLTICIVRIGKRLFRLRSPRLARVGVTTRLPD